MADMTQLMCAVLMKSYHNILYMLMYKTINKKIIIKHFHMIKRVSNSKKTLVLLLVMHR